LFTLRQCNASLQTLFEQFGNAFEIILIDIYLTDNLGKQNEEAKQNALCMCGSAVCSFIS